MAITQIRQSAQIRVRPAGFEAALALSIDKAEAAAADRLQTGADRAAASTSASAAAGAAAQTSADRNAIASLQGLGFLVFETWALLAAYSTAGVAVNQGAYVLPSDTGTHTDPVVGGTVQNYGLFRYSASPAGWKWLSGTVPTTATLPSVDRLVGALPRDPIGVWPIAGFQSTPQPYWPNLVTRKAPSLNLKRAPRRAFGSGFYAASGVTVTDNALTGPAGLVDAARIQIAGTSSAKLVIGASGGTLPAGTYTLVAHVMRNAASDQPFAFTTNNGTSRTAATATSAFQRLSYTFTLASTTSVFNIGLVSSDGATAADLALWSLDLFAGSADLGAAAGSMDDGNIYYGASHTTTPPGLSNGVLAAAPGVMSVASLPSRAALASWTISIAFQQTSTPANPFVLRDINSLTNFSIQTPGNKTGIGDTMGSSVGAGVFTNRVLASDVGGAGQRGNQMGLTGQGWHVLTISYDAKAAVEQWMLDDLVLCHNEQTPPYAPRNVQDLLMFAIAGYNIAGAIVLYDRCLDVADRRRLAYQQRLLGEANGLTFPGFRNLNVIHVNADSNHGPFAGSGAYPSTMFSACAVPTVITLWSVSGSAVNKTYVPSAPSVSARQAVMNTLVPPDAYARKYKVFLESGTNELGAYPGTDAEAATLFIADMRALCSSAAQAGIEVYLFTLIPLGDGSAGSPFNARRAIFNADVRANYALYGLKDLSHVLDIGGDATIGQDTSANNPTYYASDKRHMLPAAHTLILNNYLIPQGALA